MPNKRVALNSLRLLATMLIALPLAGCLTLGTGTMTRYVDTSCAVFEPLTYSTREDSAPTVDGIKKHNRKFGALCPAVVE